MNALNPPAAGLPITIGEYLAQLRAALHDADPAMVQDALYDAEEYLRSELAAHPGRSEAEVLADVAGSYGAPEEVADIYRETEVTVSRALRTPSAVTRSSAGRPSAAASAAPAISPVGAPAAAAMAGDALPVQRSALARFFGVALDPHTYGALFYMLLSLATGIFFFTWVVTGLSLSVSLMILIIGIPVAVLFFGSIRGLSLLEGRLVEVLLGERMPRRPLYADRSRGWMQRIGDMFTDGRTWLTMLYFLLMLPLGIVYFTIAVSLLSISLVLVWAPVAALVTQGGLYPGVFINGEQFIPVWFTPLFAVIGGVMLFATLHLARAVGRLHGGIAKHLLVRL